MAMDAQRVLECDTEFDNAIVGQDTILEPNVTLGFRYHPNCGRTRIGRHGILRMGTIIYGDVEAGDYLQTGHYTIIRAEVIMGDYCTLCHHSVLEGITRLGEGVRIMSHTYIPTRTWIGDHVFVGPGVTFLNDKYPGRCDPMPTPRGATIEDDVVIGGGVTILPEARIGAGSFIAARALVAGDVPPHSLVVGVPGRVRPLPERLDHPNNRDLTRQPVDLWHPRMPDLDAATWPPDWPSPLVERVET